jgi:hypothetical protein
LLVKVASVQLSEAVGAVQVATASQVVRVPVENVSGPAGQPLITGGVLSETVNVVEQVLLLFAASVAVIVTVVTPKPTETPASGDWVIVTVPLQLSVATVPEVKLGTRAEQVAPAEAVCAGAQVVITGGVLSETVNVVEQVLLLLAASVAVIVTVVIPKPTDTPANGDWVIITVPLQLSVATVCAVKSGTRAEQVAPA